MKIFKDELVACQVLEWHEGKDNFGLIHLGEFIKARLNQYNCPMTPILNIGLCNMTTTLKVARELI